MLYKNTRPTCYFIPLLLIYILSACSPNSTPIESDGKTSSEEQRLKQSTQKGFKRFISLAPSHCEWIYEFQAEDLLFGRSEHCDYPSQVLQIPSVGQSFPPNLERILKLAPSDVLMIDGHLELKVKLQRLGVDVHQIQPKSLNDILEQSQKIGKILGKAQHAKKWLELNSSKLKQIKKRKRKPRVLIEIWFSPLTIAGANSYMGDLLFHAGGKTMDSYGQWPNVSLESVVHFNPEILFISTPALYKQLIGPSPPKAWRTMKAVKTGKVYLLDGRLARPGPRIIDELLWMHQKLEL